MKRILLIALMILCLTVSSALAEATLFHEGSAPTIAACGDELYILRCEGLFRYDPSSGEEALVTDSVTSDYQVPGAIDSLFADEDALYGFRFEDVSLIRLDNMETVLRIEDYTRSMTDRAVTGDWFVLAGQEISGTYLDAYSLKGSTHVAWPIKEPITNLAGYRWGQALITTEGRHNQRVTRELIAVDLLNGESTVLGTLDAAYDGLAYDAESDSIYLLNNNGVYRWTDDGPVLSVYKLAGYTVNAAIFGDGLIAAQVENDIDIRRLGSAAEQSLLTIRDPAGHGTDHQAFLRAHPEVSLVFTGDGALTGEEQFTRDMVNRDGSTDIYALEDLNLLTRIYNKGYGADLSGSDAVQAAVQDMVPAFRQAFQRDGHIYALPGHVYLDVLGYDPSVFEAYGLPVPTTYDELFSLILLWEEEYADDHPEVNLCNAIIQGDADLMSVLSHYASECVAQGKPLRFSTPELAETIRLYQEAAAAAYRQNDGYGYFDDFAFATIMLPFTQAGKWLPLTASKGAAPVVTSPDITMTYYVVNPYSPRREQAAAFMESLAADWEDLTRAVLLLSTGPLTDEEGEVILTQAQLDGYHAMMDHIIIAELDPLSILAGEQTELFFQLEDGLMDAASFLRALDERTRLIALELQ